MSTALPTNISSPFERTTTSNHTTFVCHFSIHSRGGRGPSTSPFYPTSHTYHLILQPPHHIKSTPYPVLARIPPSPGVVGDGERLRRRRRWRAVVGGGSGGERLRRLRAAGDGGWMQCRRRSPSRRLIGPFGPL